MVEHVGYGASGSWHVCRLPGCTDATCEPSHREPDLKELALNLIGKGCPVDTAQEIVCRVSQAPVRFAGDCAGGACCGGSCSR